MTIPMTMSKDNPFLPNNNPFLLSDSQQIQPHGPAEPPRLVPVLSEKDITELPAALRDAASRAQGMTQDLIHATNAYIKKHNIDPAKRRFGVASQEALVRDWDALFRAFMEVAAAAREGREMGHRPLLQNRLTRALDISIPEPDRP